jgi:hypothetical protein
LSDFRKQAVRCHRLLSKDVINAPRRMQRFHCKTVPTRPTKVKTGLSRAAP